MTFELLCSGFHASIISKSELKMVRKQNLKNIEGMPVTLYIKRFAAKEVVDRAGTVRCLLTLDIDSPDIRMVRAQLNLRPYSTEYNMHATFGFIACHGRKAIVQ